MDGVQGQGQEIIVPAWWITTAIGILYTLLYVGYNFLLQKLKIDNIFLDSQIILITSLYQY